MDLQKRQTLQAVISHSDDPRWPQFIEEFGNVCLNMSRRQGKREKQLSKDTVVALFRTCNGIVKLTKNLLLKEDYEYVCLREFSTDVLEKAFGKLRQGSGGSYIITAQQITEKLRIKQAKLQISLYCDLHISACTSQLWICFGRRCFNYFWVTSKVHDLESSVSEEMKANLVYISGYVTRKLSMDVKDYDDTWEAWQILGIIG